MVKSLHRAEFWGKFFAKGRTARKLPGQAFGSHSGAASFSPLPPAPARPGSERGSRVGTRVDACPRRLRPASSRLSFSTRAGSAGQRRRRQLPRSARRGGLGHPERPPPPRPGGGGPAPAFVCATAEGRVRRKRAPSCGRSRALQPRRRGATFARPEPPSLAGTLAGRAVSSRQRPLPRLGCVLRATLCVRETHRTSHKGV